MSRDVRAAIGGVAIETTWIEYQIARLILMATNMKSADPEDDMRRLLINLSISMQLAGRCGSCAIRR